ENEIDALAFDLGEALPGVAEEQSFDSHVAKVGTSATIGKRFASDRTMRRVSGIERARKSGRRGGRRPPRVPRYLRAKDVSGATTIIRVCTRRATFPGIRMLRYVRLPVACIRKIRVPGSRTNSLRIDSGDMFQRKASSFTE